MQAITCFWRLSYLAAAKSEKGRSMRQRIIHLLRSYLPPSCLLITMVTRIVGAIALYIASACLTGLASNVTSAFSHILLFMAIFGVFAHMEATFVRHLIVGYSRLRERALNRRPA